VLLAAFMISSPLLPALVALLVLSMMSPSSCEGVVDLRLGGVEGVYNRLWHSTSQSPPVHWVYTGSHFLRFLRFL